MFVDLFEVVVEVVFGWVWGMVVELVVGFGGGSFMDVVKLVVLFVYLEVG